MKKNFVLLLIIFSITSVFGQALCGDSKEMFVVTEVMPQSSPELKSIDQLVNSGFSLDKCPFTDGDKIIVQFKLNCEGEDFDYTVKNFNNEIIGCGLGDFLQSNLTWTKAKQKGRHVDFSGSIIFEVKGSKIYLFYSALTGAKGKKK